MAFKVLFSNIAYAKDISGTLWHHISRMNRHLYCSINVQEKALGQLKEIINVHKPDLCCLVEIDSGSVHCGYFNQMKALLDEDYRFSDVTGKYGEKNPVGKLPMMAGKSNGFLAKHDLPFKKLFLSHGTKRLIYQITLPGNITLFFTHFALSKDIRKKQLEETRELVKNTPGEVILMGDFNILKGFSELEPLLHKNNLHLLNTSTEHTFTFHRRKLILDLCICTEGLAKDAKLQIIPQPFSDHAALLLTI